jgi:hypothetical protein
MGNFNVEILKDNNQAKKKPKILIVLDKFQLKSQFNENTTETESQLYHIWANVLGNECKYGVNRFILRSNYQTHFQCITKIH